MPRQSLMHRWLPVLVLAFGALAILGVHPARASIAFTFQQQGSALAVPYGQTQLVANATPFWGQLIVSDEAFQRGLNLVGDSLRNPAGFADVLDIFLVTTDFAGRRVVADRGFFLDSNRFPGFSPRALWNLVSAPGQAPTGTIRYLASGDNLTWNLVADGTFTATAGSDNTLNIANCIVSMCEYRGLVVTSVPEPSSLAILIAGLLGLAVSRRLAVAA